MSENKEEKKGFWSGLFTPKKKTSCCGKQIEIDPENIKPAMSSAPTCDSTDEGTIVIKVLGTGCSSCKALYNTVQEVVKELGINAIVEKEEDLGKIMEYNVMSLPALVINEKVVSKGRKLTSEQVKQLLA